MVAETEVGVVKGFVFVPSFRVCAALFCIAFGCQCSREAVQQSGAVEAVPLVADPARSGSFELLTPEACGVNFVAGIDSSHSKDRLYASSMAVGGIAVGDLDGDDRPEIFCAGTSSASRLFRNVGAATGGIQFEDVTEASGLGVIDGWCTGATFADIDGDDDLDLVLCRYEQPNLLFLNDGAGVFQEEAEARGLAISDASHSMHFADIDGDGDLDGYLLTNRLYHADGESFEGAVTLLPTGELRMREDLKRYFKITKFSQNPSTGQVNYEYGPRGLPDYLFLNDGTGHFTNVSAERGLVGDGRGLSVVWFDYEEDGDLDLYVANDFEDSDRLYVNDGAGHFTDQIRESVPSTPWFSMGSDLADLDGDGRQDLLIADMSATSHYKQKMSMGAMSDSAEFLNTAEPRQYMRNHLLLDSGLGWFREGAFLAGLDSTDWTWAVKTLDFDQDGRSDVFFTNGMSRNFNEPDDPLTQRKGPGITMWDRHAHGDMLREKNLAYRNEGDLRFSDTSSDWGLDVEGVSVACAHGDLDGDGDLDLVVMNLEEPVAVYENKVASGNSVVIRLHGQGANTHGVGATVEIEVDGVTQKRTLGISTGYFSSNEPVLHFGLGDAEKVDRLEVRWVSGGRTVLRDLPSGHRLVITEEESARGAAEEPTSTLLKTSLTSLPHRESDFDDFSRQPLLPNRLSRLGGALAVGDVNKDGWDDFYLAGAKGTPGLLMLNNQTGGFDPPPNLPTQIESEEMGAAFFDFNGDGNLDLYLACGSYEDTEGSAELLDHLLLGDGKGGFSKAPAGTVPDLRIASGPVALVDFDKDGWVDVFVGGRVIPGKYPLSPRSALLRNEQGKRLVDVTESLAPDLLAPGMVTSALWTDLGEDGWPDLLLATEWGPIRCFRNEEGRLREDTEGAGLNERTGWWNSLAAIDVNGDGHLDLAAGNFGTNTKYRQASAEKPVWLFYGDFGDEGVPHIVEAAKKEGKILPVRGFSCTKAAMPHIEAKLQNFGNFASSTLPDIFAVEELEEAEELEAVELRSGVFLSDGQSGFSEFQPFPREAQLAPTFGIVATELNDDGHPDLVLAQNFWSPQAETGRMDGSLGLVLTGRANGQFEPLAPAESGLRLPGDVKALVSYDGNRDGYPDLLASRNDNTLAVIIAKDLADLPSRFSVRLKGGGANSGAVGARVSLHSSEGDLLGVSEIHSGSGYLSQSAPIAFFHRPPSGAVVRVLWASGKTSETAVTESPVITIEEDQE